MTVNQMRKSISKIYPGEKWQKRVSMMKENQVMAVYYSFLEKGKFNKKKEKNHQITIEEFLGGQL